MCYLFPFISLYGGSHVRRKKNGRLRGLRETDLIKIHARDPMPHPDSSAVGGNGAPASVDVYDRLCSTSPIKMLGTST